MAADVIVLGAGIVGISCALQLARHGKSVVLVDRGEPGRGTSFGNAGVIQRDGVVPYGFPQQAGAILRYAFNNRIDVHYHWRALPRLSPFLAQYWWNSRPARHQAIAERYRSLIEHSLSTHAELAEAADATDLIVKGGWTEIYRQRRTLEVRLAEAALLKTRYGVDHDEVSGSELARREPHLSTDFAGGVHWSQSWTVKDPLALSLAYLDLFRRLGGRLLTGDARSLSQTSVGWRVQTTQGIQDCEHAVVALGPWSDDLARLLGYKFPFAVKRGYHAHFASRPGTQLNSWLMDGDQGYFLAPMTYGIRLTTGIEFARPEAASTPVQLDRAEAVARSIFPLAGRISPEPWVGERPCMADMLPVIGQAPRHSRLWFAFGHGHHGLTLGPVTGDIIANQINGQPTAFDASAFSPERFGNLLRERSRH